MAKKLAVIAIGGNSLIKDSKHQTVEDQYVATHETCVYIADLIQEGWNVIVTHGNGPQVGFILLRSDLSKTKLHEVPLDSCGADTQGAIGYHIQQNLQNEFHRRGISKVCTTVVTQVVVDKDDPSFKKPNKPIGPFYNEEEAKKYEAEKGWSVSEDAGRGWRRVVASPNPLRIVELDAIKLLVHAGAAVVAVGGGGIPVIEDKGKLIGTAAVIDKDRASALLALNLEASHFIISTAVEKVSLNFGKPDQKDIDKMTMAEAKQYMADGHFKPGSMKPKIEAAINFLESGGEAVIITSPEKLLDAVHGKTGTLLTR
ncbi:MAG: carbamate kinase [Deltaproteobacteria bacterium]|nr:carbamate kinase [Deltaproteobacteria bacterium]